MNSQIRRDRLSSAQQCRGAAQNVPSSQNQPWAHSQVCKLCFFLFKKLFENWWIGLILPTWFCGSVNIRSLKWILVTLNNYFVMRVFPQIQNIITIFMNRWRQDQCQAVGPFSSAPQLSTLPLFTTFSALLMLLYLHWATFLFFWVIIGSNRYFLPPIL